MKRKSIDLKTMWERASTSRTQRKKVASTLTPESVLVTVGSHAQTEAVLNQSTPSVEPEIETNNTQNQISRQEPEPIEPVVDSNEPEMASIEETEP